MNIGDYVRIKNGIIDKISDIDIGKNYYHIHLYNELDCYVHTKDEIIKSSPNIIDLIEVGDYVNGFYVINKPSKLFNRIIHTAFDDFCEEDIETIVTKEQFESMEYRIGE